MSTGKLLHRAAWLAWVLAEQVGNDNLDSAFVQRPMLGGVEPLIKCTGC